MADAALKRWRERCEAAITIERWTWRALRVLGIRDYKFGLSHALFMTGNWSGTAEEHIAWLEGPHIGWDIELPGLSLALRWLREEMERGDD
jgi:hypothetical protein